MKKLLWGVLVLTAAAAATVGWWWSQRGPGDHLLLAGVVEGQEVRLGSKIGGRVDQIEVVEGQTVQPDQVLVRFAIPEREAQREQARARLLAAEAVLEKAQNGARPEELAAAQALVQAAQARRDRLLKGWREEEIRQAQSEQEAADADLNLARGDFERIDRLYRQGHNVVAQDQYEAARAAVDRARGRHAAAKARLDMLRAGHRPEDIAEAEAEVQRAAANLQLLKNGTRAEDIKAAQAQVLEARARLREIEADCAEALVRAPSTALVEVVGVRRGDLVAPHQPIIRLLRTDDVWVKVFVPETRLGQVRKGQDAFVMIDSHPGRRFRGRVTHVASISEFLPRNVQSADERRNQVFAVKVTVLDEDGAAIFKPGMAASVELPLQ
jgi:multidrug resistance efflux pump